MTDKLPSIIFGTIPHRPPGEPRWMWSLNDGGPPLHWYGPYRTRCEAEAHAQMICRRVAEVMQ